MIKKEIKKNKQMKKIKKITLTTILFCFGFSTLQAVEPCTELFGTIRVKNYEECMKNPEQYKKATTNNGVISKLKVNYDSKLLKTGKYKQKKNEADGSKKNFLKKIGKKVNTDSKLFRTGEYNKK